MTVMELFDECPTPSFPKMMTIINHYTNIYVEQHNIKQKPATKLRGIGSGPRPSSPPSCFNGVT